MARLSTALERKSAIALKEEGTENTIEAHAAGDYVRHAGASLQPVSKNTFSDDMNRGVAASEHIYLGQAGALTLPEVAIRPSGSVGGTSELDGVLKGLMGSVESSASTTVNDAGATAFGCTLTDASNVDVGDLLYFTTTNEVAQILTVSTNDVTYSPKLSAAPTNGEVVVLGKQFRSADALPTFTGVKDDSHTSLVMPGIVINDGNFSFTPAETVKAGFSGLASGKRSFSGTSPQVGATIATDTTTDVEGGTGGRFNVDGGAIDIVVGVGTVNEEIVSLTSVSGDTLTHAALANGHADGEEVSASILTPTHTGTQLTGVKGKVLINTAWNGIETTVSASVRSCSVSVNNAYARETDYGNENENAAFRQGLREVTWNIAMRMDQASIDLLGQVDSQLTIAVSVWAGNAAGRIFAAGSLKVVGEFPEMSAGNAGEKILTFTGRSLEKTAQGSDDVRLSLL